MTTDYLLAIVSIMLIVMIAGVTYLIVKRKKDVVVDKPSESTRR